MRLTRLRAHNFRCFEAVTIEPTNRMNMLVGDNASGKTSLLEAIYMLGRGQSFRGKMLAQAIRKGSDKLSVHGVMRNEQGHSGHVGLENSGAKTTFQLDGNEGAKRLDLVRALPLQVVDPNLHRMLEQGPRYRRHFLDWGVFHVEHAFFGAWRSYRRALRQRNAALKQRHPEHAVSMWDEQILSAAIEVDACRRRYVDRLNAMLPDVVSRLLADDEPSINYYPGWNEERGLQSILQASLQRDIKSGYTHVGPHRADLQIKSHGISAESRLSRGQQKILAAALLLTQARIVKEETGTTPIMLIDDLAAELGASYLESMLHEIDSLAGQVFLTCLDRAHFPCISAETRTFHVEHGAVRQV